MNNENRASLLLRVGLAAVFLYIAYASFKEPDIWIAFMPEFIQQLPQSRILLYGFSAYEIFLGIWLLSNKKIFYAALLTALTLFGIVISTLQYLDIAFRDLAIMFAALALAVLHWKES